MQRVLFIASSGGHYKQLRKLDPLIGKYHGIVITELLCTIPMCLIAKMFKRRVIYIESFAKVITPTETGKFIYRHHLADAFFVQWKSMLDVYPDAVYAGSLY